jgi:hypothetical protein
MNNFSYFNITRIVVMALSKIVKMTYSLKHQKIISRNAINQTEAFENLIFSF